MKKLLILLIFILVSGIFVSESMAQLTADQILTGGHTFGSSISISGDLAVISAAWENTEQANKAGAVYVFQFNGSEWIQTQRIINPLGTYDAIFGASVATDGEYIVVNEPNRQSAHVYKLDNNTWILDTTFTVTDVGSEKYGISCAVEGNTLVVGSGAIFAGFCSSVGSAYVYKVENSQWELEAILKPSDPQAHDGFASSLDVEGDMIIVGAPRSHCYGGNEGFVCVFEREGSLWEESSKMFAPEPAANDRFGSHIDMEDGKMVVTSPVKACVYSYEYNEGWELIEILTTPNSAGEDGFGQPARISNNRLIIGASADDAAFDNQGAAYLYNFDDKYWNLDEKFVPASPSANLKFGFNVGIGRNSAMASLYNSTSVHVLNLADPPGSCIDTLFVYDTISVYDTIPVYDYISVTDTLVIDAVLTGINPPDHINTLKVYPNPAKDRLFIKTGDYTKMTGYRLKIIDQLGSLVFDTEVEEPLYELDLSDWNGMGLYYLQIINVAGELIDVRKIVLQ